MVEIDCMTPEDAAEVAELERKHISTAWSEESLKSSINNSAYCMFAAKTDEKIVGYIGTYMAADELNITNLVVDQDYRRRGIGWNLLKTAIQKGKETGMSSVYLEVRLSNKAAISLYDKCGFERIGRRKNYYDNPKEDAQIMCLNLL